MQNFAMLQYLEVTYLETSYLSVFGLCRLIIYRPDKLFEFFLQSLYLHLLMTLTSGKKSQGHLPSSLGVVLLDEIKYSTW